MATIATAATVLAGTLTGLAALPAASAERECGLLTGAVFQLRNPTSGRTLLTRSATERTSAAAYGYTQDLGAYLNGAPAADSALVPTRRMYNATTYDFTWASSTADMAALTATGYAAQHTEFYVSPTALSCTVPVRRMAKGTTTRLVKPTDVNALTQEGWSDRGFAFHAVPAVPVVAPPAPAPPTGDGKFTVAVYPDTQMEVMLSTDRRLSQRSSYVVEQRTRRDIRYVLHVGDVVNWDTASATNPDDHRQFDYASREMRTLEASGLPWATAIGNHDTYAVGPTGGSARPGVNTAVAVRDTRTFNTYFPISRFGNISGTFESGKVDNAYRLFDAEGRRWMILNLELWPRAAAVTWARNIVAAHPDRNVIVVTHSYLTSAGTIEPTNGGYGSTSGQYLYDNLIKLYPNIKLVFSGHVNSSAVRTDTGVAGNQIISMLTAFHSTSTNHVRFVEIDVLKGTIATDIYAPWTQTAFPEYTRTVSGMSWR